MQLALFEWDEARATVVVQDQVAADGCDTLPAFAELDAPAPGGAQALDLCVAGFLQNARAPRTLQAYRSDWAGFER